MDVTSTFNVVHVSTRIAASIPEIKQAKITPIVFDKRNWKNIHFLDHILLYKYR